MKKMLYMATVCVLLLAACGQSYEETKRMTRESRKAAWRKDSAALKVAVMPTLDCLPLFVAEHYQLFDTVNGGVRLKMYMSQMDCDTALERGRVEGSMTDLVRAMRIASRGTALRTTAVTAAHWQLVTNRTARVRQLKQLDDKMVAMTRFSATDLLTNLVVDSVKLDKDRVFKVQINDINIRMLMLQNNEMDALWLPEPLATMARQLKNPVVYDTRKEDIQLGVMVFRDKEMERKERAHQLELLMKAYHQACDSINKYGVRKYKGIVVERCKVKQVVADSLPDHLTYTHAKAPSHQDSLMVKKFLEKVKR